MTLSSATAPRTKRRIFTPRLIALLVGVVLVTIAYFINVEVQTRRGTKALAATGLVSRPLPEARTTAASLGKPVLVDVAAIWCSRCRTLDEQVFANAEVKKFIEAHVVFSRLEFESPEGQAFLKENSARGFPTLWLVDARTGTARRLPLTFEPKDFVENLKAAGVGR